MSTVDELVMVVGNVTDRWAVPLDRAHDIPQVASAVAAWLAEHDRAVSEGAWDGGYTSAVVAHQQTAAACIWGKTGNPYRTDGDPR